LVDRKKVPLNWKKQLEPVREKIDAALADMPKTTEVSAFLEEEESTTHYCFDL
jgi:hypothetical protein